MISDKRKTLINKLSSALCLSLLIFGGGTPTFLRAATAGPIPILQIKADQTTGKVSPMLYGLMTEEINFSYEGGLYAELIRNRSFQADPTNAVFWSAIGGAAISLDRATPLNAALNVSLKLDASAASKGSPAGIANGGYWGLPVKPNKTYRASFFAKAASGYNGPLTVAITSNDGKTTFASAEVSGITGDWKKYEVTLTTQNAEASKENQFTLTTTSPGTIWFQQVSLFPPTFNHRANGLRPDLMQLLADMNPKFLRFPGGCYLEGRSVENRFNWKKTIGPVEERPGHMNDFWGYWSTDGLGLLEFLEWCEDLKMQPVLAVYAGYSVHQPPVSDLKPCVQDALDEIEYVTGDATTRWGAQRAKDGHPAPFDLNYVEIGNEDFGDRSRSYDDRFAQFYDAIKARHPQIQVIATTMNVKSRQPDLMDEHLYPAEKAMEARAHEFDAHIRTGPKIFVGEWATISGSPTPNMAGALGDAAWMTGMERNSDLVMLSCYAPLFVNVSSPGKKGDPNRSQQWGCNLIGYDALASYGSPSYYAQKMFSTRHGDTILATDSKNIPTQTWQPPSIKSKNGVAGPRPAVEQVPRLFFNATRDSRSGTIFLKIVNSQGTPQPVKIEISGVASVESKGTATVLKANKLEDTNSLQAPTKIVPASERVEGLAKEFTRTFPPYSITVLELKVK